MVRWPTGPRAVATAAPSMHGSGDGPAAACARLGAEADLLREAGALLRVGRGDHRVVVGQAPPLAVLLGRHVVAGLEMPLEHLQLLAVLEADDVIRHHRLLDRHGGGELLRLLLFLLPALRGQRAVNQLY